VTEKLNRKDIIEKLNQQIHHLETLISTQVKIIIDLQRQVKLMRDDCKNIAAPKNSKCDCCSGIGMIVGKCGHYFCTMCIDRSHHIDCVICEMNNEENGE
jgi:hypothetical protein